MENEQPKKLTLEDCKIDWEHYRTVNIHGEQLNPETYEESKKTYEDICGYSEKRLVTRDMCYDYFYFGYYPDLLDLYCQQEHYDDRKIERLGLVKMFNEGWLTSPVFVYWNIRDYGFLSEIWGYWIEDWLFLIKKAQTQVDILNHIIKNAEYIYGHQKKQQIPHLKALLEKCKVVAKNQADEAKKKAAEEKAKQKTKKDKPEYVLSVEEIIQYVREENPDAAPAIRAMLRYFADEKDGWNSKSLKALLEPIKAQNINIYAPVGQVNANVEHQTNTLRE